MKHLSVVAYCELIRFDFYLRRNQFERLYEIVRGCPLGRPATGKPVEAICHAADVACIWYFKRVLCLQRSATTTCLLRKNGIPAQMVLGAQQIPFQTHAWVEVDGQVVNDKPYIRETYAILDRC